MKRMSRLAATKARPRRNAAPTHQASPARAVGKAVEKKFREAAAKAFEEAHRSKVAVAILSDDNEVAWLHPDGVVRPTRTPVHGADAP